MISLGEEKNMEKECPAREEKSLKNVGASSYQIM